jgi:antitoxin ParD1/3/4
MKAYRKYLTVSDPGHISIYNVPFRSGQKIEVLLLPAEDEKDMYLKELKDLFKETQQLAQAKAISEDEIYAEVEAYRKGL